MQSGTPNCRKKWKNSGRKGSNGFWKPVHFGVRKKKPRSMDSLLSCRVGIWRVLGALQCTKQAAGRRHQWGISAANTEERKPAQNRSTARLWAADWGVCQESKIMVCLDISLGPIPVFSTLQGTKISKSSMTATMISSWCRVNISKCRWDLRAWRVFRRRWKIMHGISSFF